ncbi:MAG: hypothetical protein WD096_10425 [Actinomycetota bacterium]
MRNRPAWTALVFLGGLALLVTSCSTGAPATSTPSQELSVGDDAPDFTLPEAGGSSVSLTEKLGERPMLLYFSMGPG